MLAWQGDSMYTIYKYPIDVTNPTVALPEGYKILMVAHQPLQGNFIWALVDTEAPTKHKKFLVLGTGSPILPGITYLTSWQTPAFVWHLFEAQD